MRIQLESGQGRPQAALAYADRLVDASLRSPPEERASAQEVRARVQLDLKDDAGAKKSLESAAALALDPRPELTMLIQRELAQGRPREALAYADRILAASEKAPPAERADDERQRAQIELALDDGAGAESSLTLALASSPNDLESLRMLVQIELARGSNT